jgi:diacylglycerol kinase family enzyme
MPSVTASRQLSAIAAFVAAGAAIVVAVVALIERPLLLLATLACLAIAIGSAAFALTRTGARRTAGAVLAIAAFVTPVVLSFAVGGALAAIVFAALLAVSGGTARYALGRDVASLKAAPTPGVEVGPAARPVLLMNPRSGGGKVERFSLVEEARQRRIEPIVLQPGDDLTQLAEGAVDRGADVIGMAGGDGSQALVAAVAMRHDLAHVCVPAGTRNHLAMDLGLDRDDVVGALDAFGSAVERRIDLAFIGEQVFVNNATMGLYAKVVKSPEYRDQKARTALNMLPEMLGPGAEPFTGPDGTEVTAAHLILVSNDRYELSKPEGFGSRRSIEDGMLGIVAATFRNSNELGRFVQLYAAGRGHRFPGWLEWTDSRFEVRSGAPVEVGIDGEAAVLEPPITFQSAPGALRVRLPHHAMGYSPAASTARPSRPTLAALLRTAAGRPAAIDM